MKIVDAIHSTDGMATKYLQQTHDGYLIETAYVDYYNKHIICFSSLIGCPIGCKFCISGKTGRFVRNLGYEELVTQCVNIIDLIDTKNKQILFSAMGEGEPLLNFDNLTTTLSDLKMWFPSSKLSISTSGINTKGIRELAAKKLNVKLQFSLHASNDILRKKLIPRSESLANIYCALKIFAKSGNPVEINYILMHNVNDSLVDAKGIAKFVAGTGWKVKLNRFNTFSGIPFESSKRINLFIKVLKLYGVDVEYYETNGSDIGSACGQMSHQNNVREKKSINL